MSRCFSVPALMKLHRCIRITSAIVVLNSTTVVMWVISNYIFSLTTLPVHCCSTVFTDVTSLTSSPCNIAEKADIHLGRLLLVRKLAMLRDTGVVNSSTYRSATTKCAGKVIRQTNNVKLPTILLFVEHYSGTGNSDGTWFCRWRCGCANCSWWSAVRLRSFGVTPCSSADRNWKRTRQGDLEICTDFLAWIEMYVLLAAVSPGTDLSSLWRSAAYCSWCAYRGNIRCASGGADCPAPDTSHLFSVQTFPPLPILWNFAFVNLHYHGVPLYTPMICVQLHLHLQ